MACYWQRIEVYVVFRPYARLCIHVCVCGVVGKWSLLARSHAHETKYSPREYNEFEDIGILASCERLDSKQVHA